MSGLRLPELGEWISDSQGHVNVAEETVDSLEDSFEGSFDGPALRALWATLDLSMRPPLRLAFFAIEGSVFEAIR